MTKGQTEGTCGGQKTTGRRDGGGEGGGNMKLPLSFTTLSTIAIQAGQSLIVVSVLKSGSVVHLQLVQVHPGLCEIGLNLEENQTLIQEQQQLMEKLKKHELEVLSVVDESRQSEQRRRDEGMKEQMRNRKQEEKEEVHKAMEATLKEGWSLLLRLLQRRQEVLTLAADFYGRALEFAVSIDRVEDLQIRPDRLTEGQRTYDSMRRDLLGKSLQVLSSSSVLLQKLRRLQRTEALQRRGGVLQEEEQEEQEESSQSSRGTALRLEELVETLQERRRRADQAVKLQLYKKEQESSRAGSENWSLTADKILDQNLQSGSTSAESTNLKSDSRIKETKDLLPGSRSERTRDEEPGSRADLKPESRSDVMPGPRLDQTPGSGSDVLPGSALDVKPESRSEPTRDIDLGSRLEQTRDKEPGSKADLKPESRSDVMPESSLDQLTRDIEPGSRLEETRNCESGSRLNLRPELRSDLKPTSRSQDIRDLQPDSRSDLQSGSRSNLQPGFRFEFKPGSRPEETRNLQSGFKLNLMAGSSSDLKSDSRSEVTRDLLQASSLDQTPGLKSDLKPESKLNVKPSDIGPGFRSETRTFGSRSSLDLKTDLKPASISEKTKDLQPESRSEETTELQSKFTSNIQAGSGLQLLISEETRNFELQSRSDLKPGSKSGETTDFPHRSRSDLQSDSRSDETRNLQSKSISMESKDLLPGPRLDVKCESMSDLKPESRLKQARDPWSDSRLEETRNLQLRSGLEESRNLNSGSRSEKTRILHSGSRSETKELLLKSTPACQSGSRLVLKSDPRSDVQPGSRSLLKPESRSDVQPESGSDLTHGSRSETEELSRKQEESKQHRAATASRQAADLKSMLGNETQSEHGRQALLTNHRQHLLWSYEHLVDKVWSCVQEGSGVLVNSSEVGQQLFEAEDTLNTHLQLHTQAEAAGHDLENMKQILDQIRALHTDSTSTTSPQPPSEPIKLLSPLKALTEQLKRGSTGRQTRTSAAHLSCLPDPTGPLSPELAGRADLVLKELQSLNRKIDSNLQLLQPYVTFLRTAHQVEEEMEELTEIYRRRPQKEEEEEENQEERGADSSNIRTTISSTSPVKKKQVDVCWQETLQRLLTCQELGNDYIHTVTTASLAGLNLPPVVSVVQQTLERLSQTKQEVNELLSHQQIQIQQQEYCRKYRERLLKTLQDMNCVSELLDSCTLMDLGSDLQTSRLKEHFSQARPHFIQLDAEVEDMVKSWETLRGVQDRLEVSELKGRAVKEDDLSELLKLQERVKNKIHQSESILDLTSSFHTTSKQLEVLLLSDPVSSLTGSTGLCGSSEAELSREQIQSLFKTASTLKTDICTAINHSGWTCFRTEQLETRLLSLDALSVSWLNEAARREEKVRRDQLTRLLHDDINQLRDSFKELKKRFSNLKFNYVKRGDRTRNMKAVRNQLQQVELYEEKLQVLRKRLQGVTARLGSEVKGGGVAREVEDAINELQRQMGEFGRSVSEHQKTLEMTCRLQQAMEEYQLWCEEASATIARVGKFSSECRSTEAASVLYHQFEKFVWPTVPQQEERISQITELAVRLHGVDEGQRYIEKTVSKHSEMVESIRELSDRLMELEAKLKLQSDREKEMKEETERRKETEEKEKKLKENRKMKKKEQTDNRSTQEAADMYELKETGHTPELTAEHDGKEVPVKKQTAANRKPPLQKSRSQDADRQTDRQTVVSESSHRHQTSSYCSTHTFSLSCSPVEANRKVRSVHTQLQPAATEPQATPPPSVIGPSFSDIQREFQRKEMQETGQQDASAGLSEAELQQQEVMTEDSLSNDEYECASPDDISLPPLAETPESNMVQSDVEEGFCFSSHSIHINQYSHQCRAQSDHSGTGTAAGAVRQQRESSQSCPTPPTCLHSSSRFRSESTSFVQSPLTVPPPSLVSSRLCSILRTVETSTVNVPQSADLSLSGPEPSSGSNPVHESNSPDSSSNKDNNVPEKRSASQTEPVLKGHNIQYSQPQKSTGTQGKILQNVAPKDETLPQTNPIPQVAELSHSPTVPQSSYCAQPFKGSDPDLNKDKISPQDIKFFKCSTTCSSLTTTCRSFTPNSLCHLPQANSDLRSQQESPSSQGGGGLPEVHAPILPEPNSVSNISVTSSTITSSKQSHQTVYPLHESLTSSCTQQCVHDPGMTPSSPAKPAAPPQTGVQTQALAQQSNLHVTPFSSPPHLLTPDQDPNICQPMAIREEIRLTPQIQGPPLPAPPLLPQGNASKPGPPCFTRPLSRATVMEGSPVTLEVEVTGHQEPTLTWFKDGELSATCPARELACEEGKHFLSIPEASDSDGGFCQDRAADHQYSQLAAGNSCSSSGGDEWLVAEVFDIISEDWQTWFGTLCVLLCLLYLIVL